jgi:SAM-dependent methyltransferase
MNKKVSFFRKKVYFLCFLFLAGMTQAHAVHFQESALAHRFLDGFKGIEIGASAHNSFGLNTVNVDFTDDPNSIYKQEEVRMCGSKVKVDVVARGNQLPFADNSVDFVISSHVIQQFYDPIDAVQEWLRVVRPGGYIFIISPHKERMFDKDRPRTSLYELVERNTHPNRALKNTVAHHSVWITEDFLELCSHFGWPVVAYQDVDDKVGNGFTVVIQKP